MTNSSVIKAVVMYINGVNVKIMLTGGGPTMAEE